MRDIVILLQIIAIATLLAEILYIAMQRPSKLQANLLLLTCATLIMMFGYLAEIVSKSESENLLAVSVSYIGKSYALLTSFFFIAEYCRLKITKRVKLILAVYHTIIPIIVYTNGYHHLYYSSTFFDVNATDAVTKLSLTRGPLYYLYVLTIATYFLLDIILSVREFKKSKSRETREQVGYIFGLLGNSILGYVLYMLDLTGGYDSTMAGCFAAVIFLSILFVKYRLFDVMTLANEQAMEDATSGLIVFDERGNRIYTNKAMRGYLNDNLKIDELKALSYGVTKLTGGSAVFSVNKKVVIDNGRTFGEVIEATDITNSYNYAERLKKEVAERTDQIIHIQRSVIAGFANVVEVRNNETGGHIKRTAEYVKIIAEGMRTMGFCKKTLTDEYIGMLTDVAPLHDIGKISVPDSILLKPGKLTDEEFEIMKKHSEMGARLIEENMRGVESDEYVDLAYNVAKYHHEKWDGTGYPEKLSGDDIPLCARIMAVADVYDAVRSKRCYKDSVDKDAAKNIILGDRGKHFDPTVVDAFINSIDKIEDVK